MLIVDIPNSENLSSPLAKVTSATNKRTDREACVLLEGEEGGEFTLTATDSHTHQLRRRVPEANVSQGGRVLVNGSLFKEFMATIEKESMSLAVDGVANELLIQAETDLKVGLYHEPADVFVVETLPPVVGLCEAEQLVKAIDEAVGLCEEGDLLVLRADGDQFKVYTKSKNTLFSVTAIGLRESTHDWSISIPIAVFKHLPNKLAGTAELRLHPEMDNFAISVGVEYLFIRQVANDDYSYIVDEMVAATAPDYVMLKTDPLKRDLRRATIIKDNAGMRMESDGQFIVTSCKSSLGSLRTPHQHGNLGGDFSKVSVDPGRLAAAVSALNCVDVVIEQVKEEIPAAFEGDIDRVGISLRLTDFEAPDHRTIILGTLGVE